MAIAQDEDCNSIFSCKSTLLRSKSINPYYLLTYLNSSIGQLFVLRGKRGAIQEGLNLSDLKEIIVYEASNEIQEFVERLIIKAFAFNKTSKELYSKAEESLLEELDLNEHETQNKLMNIKSFSDVIKVNRFDAEYFQPKYEDYENKIKKYKNGYSFIDDVCTDINYGTVPTSAYTTNDKDYNYIKGMNLLNTKIEGPFDKIENTSALRTKHFLKQGDIVISQMGTVGDAGVVTEELEGSTFASFTIRIRIKNKELFKPYYVALFIQSIAKENFLLRNIAQASVRKNTDLPTIKAMYIPNLNKEKQELIERLILNSIEHEQKSSSLLKVAKKLVELSVENSEGAAIEWAKGELVKLGVTVDA